MAMTARDREYGERILAILRKALRRTPCRVYLFGSRAAGTAREGSDFDIAVQGGRDSCVALGLAREWLEESTIPFSVDLVDLAAAPQALRDHVQLRGILLWTNSASA